MRAEHTPDRPIIVLVEERGIALIAALMIMLLMSALMIGFTTVVMSDQRFRGIDKDRARAYYGAQSGLEKLTSDMGELYAVDVAMPAADVAALSNNPPSIPGVTFVAPPGVNAYGVTPVPFSCNGVTTFTCSAQIQTGPYQGLMALKKTYNLDAVARTASGGEAHLMRKMETVAIPVFQFGTFSDVDLSVFAGGTFTFGGRIHTNGNFFLTAQNGGTTTILEKVTAVGDIIRKRMQNGVTLNFAGFEGTLRMATAPSTFRTLLATEGSLTDGVGSAPNLSPNWQTTSIGTYNGYIRNGGCPPPGPPTAPCPLPPRGTGAKRLDLALISPIVGGQNTDLARRPPPNEDAANELLFKERLFSQVSMRILLSDFAADITSLPTVTGTAPVRLGDEGGPGVDLTNAWVADPPVVAAAVPPAGYVGGVPIARSPGLQTITTTANTAAGATTIAVAGANPGGVFNVPGIVGGASSMRFDVLTAGLVPLQTINCLTVTATSATQITFGTCLKGAGAVGLLAVPAASIIRITDINGRTQNYQTVGAVASTANNTTTRNYVVTATAATTSLVTNTFWMRTNAADRAWSVVTCLGITTNTNTANGGPFGMTQLSSCNGVPATTAGAGVITTAAAVAQNVGTIGGFLKIEIQRADGTGWQDVTTEILNYGFADRNQAGIICADPTPNAIIRLQRLKDNAHPTWCNYAGSVSSYDYWPQTIFDAREALFREVAPANKDVHQGGVMHYVALDVGNLNRWLRGLAPYAAGNGLNVLSNNGYGIYFSDRRNNRADGANGTTLNAETGEYGFEDFVNPLQATGLPVSGGVPDAGEDLNGNTFLEVYGQNPNFLGVRNNMAPLPVAPLAVAGDVRPWTAIGRATAMTSRAYLFRRALKLVNGGLASFATPGVTGLTVVAENPVYIQGDWNWNSTANLNDPHAATSVIADAVTLLSSAWTDSNSFVNPWVANDRDRVANWYRLGIIGGKGRAFPWPAPGNPDGTFGTDGGAHNFLRYLEAGAGTTNYRGAIATFYYSRQGVGTYKFGNGVVYSAPTRAYAFDTDFLDPARLPPLTPVFRDINALGFSQEIRPGK